ncbi:hypothetical protein PG991_003514 [Apiospora marii]|uniref:Uncharacterized protein n=1 Tax=Apiospora marii TaxID=335849 RepID=A0ABR1S523_9PEZI
MRASTIFATLAATAAATPVAIRASDYQWDVTEWDGGCDNVGCDYKFNIAGAATSDYPARPAFKATCSGRSVDAQIETQYTDCKLEGDVKASMVSKLNKPEQLLGSRTVIPLQVSFQFADLNQEYVLSPSHSTKKKENLFTDYRPSNTYWNYTGHANTSMNRGGEPPLSFTILPKESFGIA